MTEIQITLVFETQLFSNNWLIMNAVSFSTQGEMCDWNADDAFVWNEGFPTTNTVSLRKQYVMCDWNASYAFVWNFSLPTTA